MVEYFGTLGFSGQGLAKHRERTEEGIVAVGYDRITGKYVKIPVTAKWDYPTVGLPTPQADWRYNSDGSPVIMTDGKGNRMHGN